MGALGRVTTGRCEASTAATRGEALAAKMLPSFPAYAHLVRRRVRPHPRGLRMTRRVETKIYQKVQ